MTTNFGDIEIELNTEKAPVSSEILQDTVKTAFITVRFFIVSLRVYDQGGGHTEDMTENPPEHQLQMKQTAAKIPLVLLQWLALMRHIPPPHNSSSTWQITTFSIIPPPQI